MYQAVLQISCVLHNYNECVNMCVVSGNRLVENCGLDRTKLCTPCEPGTYTDHPLRLYCKKCTQCIGMASNIFWASQDSSKSIDINTKFYHIDTTLTTVGTEKTCV